jgi:hypothetical protein
MLPTHPIASISTRSHTHTPSPLPTRAHAPLEVRRDGEACVALDAILYLVGRDNVDVLRGGRGAAPSRLRWRASRTVGGEESEGGERRGKQLGGGVAAGGNLDRHEIADEERVLDLAGFGHHPVIVQWQLLMIPSVVVGVVVVVELLR